MCAFFKSLQYKFLYFPVLPVENELQILKTLDGKRVIRLVFCTLKLKLKSLPLAMFLQLMKRSISSDELIGLNLSIQFVS